MHMHKQIQGIYGICVFQVQSLQGPEGWFLTLRAYDCHCSHRNSIENLCLMEETNLQ